MIEEVVIYLMMTDVIQNPSFPSICPTNCRKSPLNIKFELKMIAGKVVSKISPKAIVPLLKHFSSS